MKTLKLLLILILGLILISCEQEELPKSCNCHIEGKKMISFDNGKSWDLNEIDGRTGMLFPCSYNGLETNQETTNDGIKYKTVWKCRD